VNKIIVKIPIDIIGEIAYFTNNCNVEIGGLLGFEAEGENVIKCKRILTMPGSRHDQAYFEISQKDIADKLIDLSLKGDGFVVNGWWHSHVNMDVFESATDSGMVKDLLQFTPIVVTLVTNKSGELHTGITVKVGNAIIPINANNIETVIVSE